MKPLRRISTALLNRRNELPNKLRPKALIAARCIDIAAQDAFKKSAAAQRYVKHRLAEFCEVAEKSDG